MGADSVHGVIENSVKHSPVWAPSEWATVIRQARHTPFPYEVIPVVQSAILDWNFICSFRPSMKNDAGERVEWKTIRLFKVQDGISQYCSSVTSLEWRTIIYGRRDRSGRPAGRELELPPPTFTAPLPISLAKYNDLNELYKKGAIPPAYDDEYRRLFVQQSATDMLDETDEEEEDNDG